MEHPNEHTEGGGDGQDVHGDGFDGNDHGTNLQEDEEGGGDENEGQRSGQIVSDGFEVVGVVGRKSSDEHAVVVANQFIEEHVALVANFFHHFTGIHAGLITNELNGHHRGVVAHERGP